ncbi:MAG: hypothetical protein ACRDKS_12575 [Actinomycetota bacterium]
MTASLVWEILLPRTDAGTIAQWILVLSAVPASAFVLHRRGLGDVAVFVTGLGVLALAWFAVRGVH